MKTKIIMMSLMFLIIMGMASATTYYVSNSGNDSLSGTSEANAVKTITKVNTFSLVAGDSVLFKRGDVWHSADDAFIDVISGNSSADITYSSYGVGNLPIITGSHNVSSTSNWSNSSTGNPNIWRGNWTQALEIGSLIFNNETSVGTIAYNFSDLSSQGEFWYNSSNDRVYVYSTTNPASYYSIIEAGIQQHVFDTNSNQHVTIKDLDLRYGAAHGVGGSYQKNISVINCTFKFIGGAYQTGTTRYGNCVEFYDDTSDNLVDGGYFEQCFDAAMTSQRSNTKAVNISNTVFKNAVVKNSRYCFEFFNNNVSSHTTNILIDHLSCISDAPVMMQPAVDQFMRISRCTDCVNFSVHNTLFYNQTYAYSLGSGSSSNWQGDFNSSHNGFYANPLSSYLFDYNGTTYTNLSTLRAAKPYIEIGSLQIYTSDIFVNASAGDYRLKSDSGLCNISSTGSYVGALPCSNVSSCTTPYSGMNITSDTTFCAGTYVFNHTLVNDTGVITLVGNVTLNGNGAVIQAGDYWYPNASVPNRFGVSTDDGNSSTGAYVYNLSIIGFNVNLKVGVQNGGEVKNVYLANALDHNLLTSRLNNVLFENITSYNSSNSGVYIYGEGSYPTNNVTIKNSLFNLTESNNCIHPNFVGLVGTSYDIRIINNTFDNCVTAIDPSGTRGIVIANNTIYNTSSTTINIKYDTSFGNPPNATAHDTEITGNTFYYSPTYTIFMYNYTNGTYIHDNHWNYPIFLGARYSNGGVDFRLYENTSQYLRFQYHSASINANAQIFFNYSGIKNISVINNTINITTDGIYNDIRFVNGSLIASNVDSYSLTLLSGQQVEVGDFVQEIVNPVFSLFGSLTIYNKDFYIY